MHLVYTRLQLSKLFDETLDRITSTLNVLEIEPLYRDKKSNQFVYGADVFSILKNHFNKIKIVEVPVYYAIIPSKMNFEQ